MQGHRVGRPLLGEPLFALLHVFIEQLGHVGDHEREHDRCEEFRRPSELALDSGSQLWSQTGVSGGNGLHRDSTRVLVEELHLREESAEPLYVRCG